MTNRYTLQLLVAVALLSVASAVEIRHIEADGAHLVDTTNQNYALTSYPLQSAGYKTVSVNGNNVVLVAANCQSATKTLNMMSQQELAPIKLAKDQLEAIENNFNQVSYNRYAVTRLSLVGGTNMRRSSRNINMNSYNMNGLAVQKQDENNFSISKPQMPNNLARVFVMNDVVTYVYLNGQVLAKPMSCLNQIEQQQMQQIKTEMAAAERNMQLMQTNLQQNMLQFQQNMQQSMQNMFGNGGYPYRQQQMGPMNYGMPTGGYGGASAYAGNYMNNMAPINFSQSWPFGPNNNPFGQGFPFSG